MASMFSIKKKESIAGKRGKAYEKKTDFLDIDPDDARCHGSGCHSDS